MPMPFLQRVRRRVYYSGAAVAALTPPGNPAQIGTASDSGLLATTLAVTCPAGIGTGNYVLVSFAVGYVAGSITCADARSNTYTAVVDKDDTANVRVVGFYAKVTTALQTSDAITVTFPSVAAARAMAAHSVAGVAASSPLDQTATASGASSTPSSGNVTTTVGGQLLFGVIGTAEATPIVGTHGFTAGTGWTELTNVTSTGAAEEVILLPVYRVEAATLTAAANGTTDRDGTPNSRAWAAGVYTLKGT